MTKELPRHKMVSFRADDQTLNYIDELEADVEISGTLIKNKRSIALRNAIATAWDSLQARKRGKKR